jgi:HEAT repeat protein
MDRPSPAMRFKGFAWPWLTYALLMALAVTLAGCQGGDVAELIQQLKDEDEDVRYRAAKALEDRGEAAKPAIGALSEAAQDQDPKVRYRAVKAISKIGANAAAVPALAQALQEDNSEIVYYAAKSLEELGADAKPAVPSLIKALQDKRHQKSHYYVLKTLKNVGPDAADAIPAVKAVLQDSDQSVREAAASALRKIEKK